MSCRWASFGFLKKKQQIKKSNDDFRKAGVHEIITFLNIPFGTSLNAKRTTLVHPIYSISLFVDTEHGIGIQDWRFGDLRLWQERGACRNVKYYQCSCSAVSYVYSYQHATYITQHARWLSLLFFWNWREICWIVVTGNFANNDQL